jgi:hypothetical protein
MDTQVSLLITTKHELSFGEIKPTELLHHWLFCFS